MFYVISSITTNKKPTEDAQKKIGKETKHVSIQKNK
jgi:hypothetical protein